MDNSIKYGLVKILCLLMGVSISLMNNAQTFSLRYGFLNDNDGNGGVGIEILDEHFIIDGVGNDLLIGQQFGVFKIDLEGNLIDVVNLNEEGYNEFTGFSDPSIVINEDSYLTVFTSDSIGENTGRYTKLIKLNSSLELVNSYEQYTDSVWSAWNQVVQTPDQGFLIIGSDANAHENETGIEIVKLNSELELEWNKYVGAEIDFGQIKWLYGYRVVNCENGGYLIAGLKYKTENPGICSAGEYQKSPIFIRVDDNGDEIWRRQFTECYASFTPSLCVLSDGNYIIGLSEFNDESSTLFQNWRKHRLIKIDDEGETIWDKTYGDETIFSNPIKTLELEDGKLLTLATQYGPGPGALNAILLKTEANGDSIWHRQYRYAEETQCILMDIIQTPDGGFAATGNTRSSDGFQSQDMWLLKLNEFGCLTDDCAEFNSVANIDKEDLVYSFGPNPVVDQLYLDLGQLPDNLAMIDIVVYDITGKQVLKKIENVYSNSSITVDLKDLPSGLFVLNLINSNLVLATERFVIH